MAHSDRKHWDDKWAAYGSQPMPAVNRLLLRYENRLGSGEALDLACGLGQNAIWLAERGYHVTGMDISPLALERAHGEAQERGLKIEFVAVDFDHFSLAQMAYDMVTVFRFLDRRLFPAIEEALRPGGWLFYETFNVKRLNSGKAMQRDFLLEADELAAAFARLEVVEANDDDEMSYFVGRRK